MPTPQQPSRRQGQLDASYEAVVRSAIRCFSTKGYSASTIDEIATEAGRTKGAFYLHFANKIACFFAVGDYRERQRRGWEHAADDLDPATTSLADVLVRTLVSLDERSEGTRAWTAVVLDVSRQHRDDPETLARIHALYRDWCAEIERFLVILCDRGWLPENTPVGALTVKVLAWVEGMNIHGAIFGLDQPGHQAAIIEGLLELMVPEGTNTGRSTSEKAGRAGTTRANTKPRRRTAAQ